MISFVILTIGDKPEKLNMCINSIHRNFSKKNDYEIIIVGNNIESIREDSVKIVEDNDKVEFLGARKNIGTRNSVGEIIVHCDDDMIFPYDWYENFTSFNNKEDSWLILGHKVLLPDGSRHWDRATYLPLHRMVPYDYESETDTFYQTGGFSISKRKLLEKISWSDDIPYYGMFKGFKHNEDVEFSIRLKENGVKIFFDKNNTVWHYDFSYSSDNVTCNKKQKEDKINYKHIGFLSAISNLDKK